jgi:enamine deaminase RidA (YjgF/YER057c/UK114 family)
MMKKRNTLKKLSAKVKSKTHIRRTNPAALYEPNGYTHVVEATGRRSIYLSGQTPVDKQGNVIGAGDFRAQAVQVFENLKLALAAAGARFSDVVKANYYVLDMSNITVLREVRRGYLGSSAPASTLVEVRRLANDGFLVEIEMIAICAK